MSLFLSFMCFEFLLAVFVKVVQYSEVSRFACFYWSPSVVCTSRDVSHLAHVCTWSIHLYNTTMLSSLKRHSVALI